MVNLAQIREMTKVIPQPVRFGARKLAYYGSGKTCLLCDNNVRHFIPHGGGAEVLDRRKVVGGMKRDEDRCPVCHGADRTRMMMRYLETHTDIGKKPTRVLHVAPEFGLYLWMKRLPQVDYVGTDIDVLRYRHIEGIQSADLTNLPFENGEFDIIACSHVLEHVPDDMAAFRELYRVLKPGGQALLLTPYALDGQGTDEDITISDPAERDRRFGQWDHVRIYDRSDFVSRMESAGFETTLYDPFKDDPGMAEELHLNPIETLPIGHKPIAN